MSYKYKLITHKRFHSLTMKLYFVRWIFVSLLLFYGFLWDNLSLPNLDCWCPLCVFSAEKGFCLQGDLCPYSHGADAVVMSDVTGLQLASNSATAPLPTAVPAAASQIQSITSSIRPPVRQPLPHAIVPQGQQQNYPTAEIAGPTVNCTAEIIWFQS